jgi:hypothetical protein
MEYTLINMLHLRRTLGGRGLHGTTSSNDSRLVYMTAYIAICTLRLTDTYVYQGHWHPWPMPNTRSAISIHPSLGRDQPQAKGRRLPASHRLLQTTTPARVRLNDLHRTQRCWDRLRRNATEARPGAIIRERARSFYPICHRLYLYLLVYTCIRLPACTPSTKRRQA